ncbi:MAG: M15 family metallopeptidase [Nitrospirota bacterium]
MPAECTYVVQTWNVDLKSSLQKQEVRHPYDEITSAETDPATGCTVCSEDQILVDLPPLQAFSVCHQLALRVRSLIRDLVRYGAPLNAVIGYRVIKSRGPVDGNGNRTGFSNHSFGTAIDINPEQNGLYDNCIDFGPQCRLIRGGEWKPGAAGTLEHNDDIVRSFKAAGFKWGGEIAGKQKDFMHFSLTGY